MQTENATQAFRAALVRRDAPKSVRPGGPWAILPTGMTYSTRIQRLHRAPDELDQLIEEAAQGLEELYGPEAGADYRRRAPAAMRGNIGSPAVYAFGAFRGDVLAGLLLSVLRGRVGEIPFIHVLEGHAGEGVEEALVEAAVTLFRSGGVDGILSECLPLCEADLRGPFSTSGFTRIRRELMVAPLSAPGLMDAPGTDCPAITDDQWESAADVLVRAYAGHPGRVLHVETGSRELASEFLGRFRAGSFGATAPAYSRAHWEGEDCNGIILGCEVAPATGFVLQVAVCKAAHGRGLGTALLKTQAAAFRRAGLARVSLGVTMDNPARRLYTRLGFAPLRGMDAFVWWRPGCAPRIEE